MEDMIRMDSHKLVYHPCRVADWLQGKDIYPIEVEISPSGACNHRCIFCAVDYVGYQPDFLQKDIILREIRRMAGKGLRSVICSGEGEPLLNKDMADIANGIKSYGVDVAMSTNGVLLTEDIAKECLKAFTWIRFSIASMEGASYDRIQRGRPGDLEKVAGNLEYAVKVKKDQNLQTTLGAQCLLLPDNMAQLPQMARQLREIGMDYLAVKPYSQHLHSKNAFEVDYRDMLGLEKEIRQYATDKFSVYFRANAMQKVHKEKSYGQCYGLPFMTHIDAKGNVWPCVAHIGAEGLCYGNIYEQSFDEIWKGERRRQVMAGINGSDINAICREACRLDEINKYLDGIKHPGSHVNFI